MRGPVLACTRPPTVRRPTVGWHKMSSIHPRDAEPASTETPALHELPGVFAALDHLADLR